MRDTRDGRIIHDSGTNNYEKNFLNSPWELRYITVLRTSIIDDYRAVKRIKQKITHSMECAWNAEECIEAGERSFTEFLRPCAVYK